MSVPTHMEMLERLHPRGAVDAADAEVYQSDLVVLAAALDLADEQRLLLLDELLPERADALIASWERVYGIRRVAGRTLAQRRDAVLARRRLLPSFAPAALQVVFEQLTGVSVSIDEPFAFRCDDAGSVCDEPDDVLDGAFVFYVTMGQAAAAAAGVDRLEVEELIGTVKPSHTIGFSKFVGNFCTDDAYSTTDRDRLGA